jgi:hypothetical protein
MRYAFLDQTVVLPKKEIPMKPHPPHHFLLFIRSPVYSAPIIPHFEIGPIDPGYAFHPIVFDTPLNFPESAKKCA